MSVAIQGKVRAAALLAAAASLIAPGLTADAAQRGSTTSGSVHRVEPFASPESLRLQPVDPSKITADQRELLGPGDASLDVRLCASNLELCQRYFDLKTQLTTRRMSIPVRDHVLLGLRTAWLNRSEAMWGTIVGVPGRLTMGSRALSPEEIVRVAEGPDAEGWTRLDAAILRAADELHTYRFVHDPTWKVLAFWYNDGQLFEIAMTVGHYTNMSGYFNSAGIPPPPGAMGMPEQRVVPARGPG